MQTKNKTKKSLESYRLVKENLEYRIAESQGWKPNLCKVYRIQPEVKHFTTIRNSINICWIKMKQGIFLQLFLEINTETSAGDAGVIRSHGMCIHSLNKYFWVFTMFQPLFLDTELGSECSRIIKTGRTSALLELTLHTSIMPQFHYLIKSRGWLA